ncbi:low temperature requirement protein A [Nonomuraea sp. NPDC050691]|uniref:low temperature requirement protein A n=1 Tax=Nonomuraea sp. NPDC050691 TaxID=3155661 RepID=UPI0033D95F2E
MTLYANVRAEQTHTRSMLIGMFGIAVMAAAAPDVAHEIAGVGTHDGWFIAAYIACRISVSKSLQAAGTVMTAWPAAQLGAGLAPWFVSTWLEPPGRYVMWGLGVVLDVAFSVLQSRRPERFVDEMRKQAERLEQRERRRPAVGRTKRRVRTAVPGAGERGLKPYIALPAHFAMTAGITATAAPLRPVARGLPPPRRRRGGGLTGLTVTG